MEKFYFVILVSKRTGRESVAVQVDFGLDLMDAFSRYIELGDDIIKVYPMRNLEQAEKVAQKINSLQDKKLQYMEEIVMESGMTEVYQELEYEREDPERDNYRIARMDKSKRDEIEKMTDDIYERLQEYHEFMRRMVGDGAYTHNIQQVQHHFGQIRGDLFDPLSGLM